MRKKIALLGLFLAMMCAGTTFAQDQKGGEGMPPREMQRPSAYELANQVKKDLNLTDKEYSKVHSAYEKYIKSVFGDDSQFSQRPQGNRPGGGPGGPGGGGGPRGGMGGHGGGGGMPPQGGMDNSNGNFGGQQGQKPAPTKQMTEDMEKFQKTVKKADEKLCKSVKKVLKKYPAKYEQWLQIKDRQMDRMFPKPPAPKGDKPDDK